MRPPNAGRRRRQRHEALIATPLDHVTIVAGHAPSVMSKKTFHRRPVRCSARPVDGIANIAQAGCFGDAELNPAVTWPACTSRHGMTR